MCPAILTVLGAITPLLLVYPATSEGDATDVAVTAVLAALLLAIFAVPALLVLRSLRRRSLQRRQLLQILGGGGSWT